MNVSPSLISCQEEVLLVLSSYSTAISEDLAKRHPLHLVFLNLRKMFGRFPHSLICWSLWLIEPCTEMISMWWGLTMSIAMDFICRAFSCLACWIFHFAACITMFLAQGGHASWSFMVYGCIYTMKDSYFLSSSINIVSFTPFH